MDEKQMKSRTNIPAFIKHRWRKLGDMNPSKYVRTSLYQTLNFRRFIHSLRDLTFCSPWFYPLCLGLLHWYLEILRSTRVQWSYMEQGKSEGFESCDRPIVRKRPIWVKIGDVLSRVTLKLDGWPWKTIGHLSFAVSSFVQHFIAIGEFKLELQSGNAQSRSISTIFLAARPWHLTDDLQKE